MQKHRGRRKRGRQGTLWLFGLRLSGIGDCLDSKTGLLCAGCELWTSHSTSLSLRIPSTKWGES